ncbi:6634_t:CDS:2 [Paraglomus occultum]|uniref:6634_t:CDS:1 n=1 Tax=Paraglomus occultum TaxID=144539 RepID=A0A9N9FVR2_9GLOM|nr:6634_t:CDS:2 [Paraglomus occultum]
MCHGLNQESLYPGRAYETIKPLLNEQSSFGAIFGGAAAMDCRRLSIPYNERSPADQIAKFQTQNDKFTGRQALKFRVETVKTRIATAPFRHDQRFLDTWNRDTGDCTDKEKKISLSVNGKP